MFGGPKLKSLEPIRSSAPSQVTVKKVKSEFKDRMPSYSNNGGFEPAHPVYGYRELPINWDQVPATEDCSSPVEYGKGGFGGAGAGADWSDTSTNDSGLD